jgi:glucose-6-phosphate isomerase
VTIPEVSEYYVGMLIALFERTVGLYASLVDVNAYHQPGVEAGKKAAAAVLDLQTRVVSLLRSSAEPLEVEQIAAKLGTASETETIFKVARHLAANGRLAVQSGASIFDDRYSVVSAGT